MSSLAKIRVVALSAAVVLVPSLAHAVADQDNNVSPIIDTYFPAQRRFLDLSAPRRGFIGLWGSVHGPGCGNTGNPVPVLPLNKQLGSNPYYGSFYQDIFNQPIRSFEPGAQGPRADPRWFVSPKSTLRGTFGAGFRSPNVSELFGSSEDAAAAWSAALRNLQAESDGDASNSLRIGVKWKPLDNFDVGQSFYGNDISRGNRGVAPKGSGDRIDVRQSLQNYSNFTETWFNSGSPPTLRESGDSSRNGLSNYQPDRSTFMLFPDLGSSGVFVWPGLGARFTDLGAGSDPYKGVFGASGAVLLDPSLSNLLSSRLNASEQQLIEYYFGSENFVLPTGNYGSVNIESPVTALNPRLQEFVTQEQTIGNIQYTTLFFDAGMFQGLINGSLQVTVATTFEDNHCRVVLVPTDPNYQRTGKHGGGSWGQRIDDQWAIKRVGYTNDEYSAWNLLPDSASPVIIAVVDTGLDWHHLDIDQENIWRNENEVPDNGIDDDGNGYTDDVIGWDFIGAHNKPWDFDGHGTVVAGIIAAAQDNDAGIAGINPYARIMVLKAVNNFGATRASYIAEAIVYAVDNGARVINLSVGGPHSSRIEQAAINYAHEKGVLVVAASGNDGVELDDFGPGGGDHVLTVGATHDDDRAAAFSNFGDSVDLVAPGVDVLSLRARYTDANYRPASNTEYEIGTNYVGEDKRYLHVSGTSFSTPIVSATASMLLAKNPDLTGPQVTDLLLQTAEDLESPGKDKYTGHGMLNAQAAMSVEPGFFVTADITGIQLVQAETGDVIHVLGSIDASSFKRAWMQIGPGETPGGWRYVGQKRKYAIHDGVLGTIPITQFAGNELWQIVINVEHSNGVVRRARYPVRIK
jgi:hypothetical protein